jgi:hypothetical protein
MEFNGFRVFPVGQAELSIENNLLRVSNISDSGLDGILIEQAENCTVNFNSLPQLAEYNGVLSASTIKRNALGHVVTSVQAFTWYDEKIDRIVFGYNSSYLPRKYTIYGNLYVVDEVGISYNIQYPEEYIGNPAIHYTQIAKEITGYKIPYFEITSIRKEE